MTLIEAARKFWKTILPPQPASDSDRITEAADRIESAAKRIEEGADKFGELVQDMRRKPPAKKKAAKA